MHYQMPVEGCCWRDVFTEAQSDDDRPGGPPWRFTATAAHSYTRAQLACLGHLGLGIID